ncbi:hypothetical protein O3G_MSEX007128 [Manduca sexta]|uniref:Uncharacterized protein n=1 Tax=Manduca sexta TaxID=7130 RepID=A0A921Z6C9_MANSE|nr:hypothetical protein O3G_MSEX007128 [Manduca sexta]
MFIDFYFVHFTTQTHFITHLSPKKYAEAQPGHQLFAKCAPSHDVIGGEPIAILGLNSRLRADTEQKNKISLCPTRALNPGPQSAIVPCMHYNSRRVEYKIR